MRDVIFPLVAFLTLVGAGVTASADELADFKIIGGNSIPESLTGKPGNPANGKDVAINLKLGNCLSCHQIPALRDQTQHGNLGPNLGGVASRLSEGQMRLLLVDAGIAKPESIMPAFYRNEGFHEVMPRFEGKTILTAAQIEDVLAFLMTMKTGDGKMIDGLSGNEETEPLTVISLRPNKGSDLTKVVSGYWFQDRRTREIFDDDFQNPGFFVVEDGEALWTQAEGKAGKSCSDCHGDGEAAMKGVGARYPVFHEPSGKLINLEQRINLCRTENQQAEPWNWGSNELVGMTTYIRYQSRGMPVNVSIEGPARPFFEKGRDYFFQRRGQINMSCDQCHGQYVGKWLRGHKLSQAQTASYPHYGLYFSKMDWTHQIFNHCVEKMRSPPPEYGAEEYVNLELFMAWRGMGLPVETPGVR
ncbi:MAG: sulfur oxidation c-type cytochrome SoxA [Alphaproteobacteria bacterium]|nr:sulfur oxidation c-type cytochrome SoxA [Alphaproteobacteria bacterium]